MKKLESKTTYKSFLETISIEIEGTIKEERVNQFKIDLKRAQIAINKKRRTSEEAGLWIISKYPDYKIIFKHLITRKFLSIADRFEVNDYIDKNMINSYNEEIKNLQELQKLEDQI